MLQRKNILQICFFALHLFILSYTQAQFRQKFNVDKYLLSCLLPVSERGHGRWKMAQLFRTWEAV